MFYYNQYNILYKKLTFYNFDKDGITAKIPANFQLIGGLDVIKHLNI